MPTCTFIVLSNALDGRDDEFNAWYSDIHIHDALKVRGMRSAQRFTLTDVQRRDPPHEYRYLCIYEVESEHLAEAMATLRRLSGTEVMPVSETFAPNPLSFVFRPITEKVLSDGKGSLS